MPAEGCGSPCAGYKRGLRSRSAGRQWRGGSAVNSRWTAEHPPRWAAHAGRAPAPDPTPPRLASGRGSAAPAGWCPRYGPPADRLRAPPPPLPGRCAPARSCRDAPRWLPGSGVPRGRGERGWRRCSQRLDGSGRESDAATGVWPPAAIGKVAERPLVKERGVSGLFKTALSAALGCFNPLGPEIQRNSSRV